MAADFTEKSLVQAAALILVESALDLIQSNPHKFVAVPYCPTCQAVGTVLKKPFGCTKLAATKKKTEAYSHDRQS